MNQFYATLPSNTEENCTASNFRVTLAQRVKLNGDWEVGLVEIIYPNSWANLNTNNDNNTIQVDYVNGKSLFTHDINIKPGYYQSLEGLTTQIIRDINEFKKSKNLPITSINMLRQDLPRIDLSWDTTYIQRIFFGKQLAQLLGFKQKLYEYNSEDSESTLAEYNDKEAIPKNVKVNIKQLGSDVDMLYIYCNVIENQIIGNTLAPLLRIVDTTGKFGDLINRTFDNPHYVPVLNKDLTAIEINIKNDMNEFIQFEFGKVVIKLHFRMRSFF